MEPTEERISILESKVKLLEEELKNVGKATPLTIPLKTLVYILYVLVAIIGITVIFLL